MQRFLFSSAGFCALLLAMFHSMAFALPTESRVPGGVAHIKVGTVDSKAGGVKPEARFNGERVWVTQKGNDWVAVVGIALDTPAGKQTLQLGQDERIVFEVAPKSYTEQHVKLKDQSKVTLSAEDLERARRETEIIQRIQRHWRDLPSGPEFLTFPVQGRLSSRFGLRRIFNGEPRRPHSGLDIAVPRGTPVKAGADGRVINVGDYFFSGNIVFVDHGNGFITLVAHLDKILVHEGQDVKAGDILGLAGSTGRSSGPHVHWGVILNGVLVEPLLFVKQQK